MQLRDSVDRVASDDCQVGHAHVLGIGLLDDADLGDCLVVHGEVGHSMLDEAGIDLEDDLHVSGKDVLEHRHGPLLEGFRHERVVGVAHALLGDVPCGIPVQILLVDQDSHELGDCNRGVCVVELDCGVLRQFPPVLARALESSDDIGQGAGHEEVLLLESEDLAQILGVVGVEHLAYVLGLDLVAHCLGVVAHVELFEAELFLCLGAPESERVDGLSAVADDRHVIGHSDDLVGIDPLVVVAAVLVDHLHASAEVHGVLEVRSGNLPGIAVAEPVVGLLDLIAVPDLLAEDSVVVSDSVAERGDFQCSHRIQKACGQSSETSVAESGIGLDVRKLLIGVSEVFESLGNLVLETHVGDVVGHCTAHEEFEGEVVDPLCLCGLLGLSGDVPLMDDPVADRESQRIIASLHRGVEDVGVLGVLQVLGEILLDCACSVGNPCILCFLLFALGHVKVLVFSKIGNSLIQNPKEINDTDGEYIRKKSSLSIALAPLYIVIECFRISFILVESQTS